LSRMASHHAASCESIAEPAHAIDRALQLAAPDGVVFITGSLFLVGEARPRFVTKTNNLQTAGR
jgi:folylpolyglutamate synthase/dihydropteroate synthase